MQEEEFNNILSNFYDDFFKLNLISQNEPIILMGPSSYKTKLAEFFIESKIPKLEKQYNIIFLNQKTTVDQLLGSPNFISQKNTRQFFYELLCKISREDLNIIENMNNKIEEDKILRKITDKIYKYKTYLKGIIENLINNIKKDGENNKRPKIVFSPGSVLSSILEQKSIIFKNIEQISSVVFERFNELFGTESIIRLNEDIYETFFLENSKKIIDLKTFEDAINT